MPRPADPAARDRLLTVAARVLAADGPRALSARRLAADAGTSTMSVYTYFGGMDQLRRELRRDGFHRLCSAMDELAVTSDPVSDLAAALHAYVTVGVEEPAVYRALFIDSPPDRDDEAGSGVYDRVRALVERCVETGRFECPPSSLVALWAAEVWLTGHGAVHLTHAGLLPAAAIRSLQGDMLYRLVVGFGDRPERARASIDAIW